MPEQPPLPADLLDFFFTSPEYPHTSAHREGQYSTLYLLRREIQECLLDDPKGKGPQPEAETIRLLSSLLESGKPIRRVFASTMLLLAGIDLLGKFAAGNDDDGNVKCRFTAFVKTYMRPKGSLDAETLYAVRNALMHSFGLHVKEKGEEHKRLELVLKAPKTLVVRQSAGVYQVNTLALYRGLVCAIRRYEKALHRDTGLHEHFEAMFNKYGFILIQLPAPNQ